MGPRTSSAPPLGPLEAAIMEVLWTTSGDATVRCVADALNATSQRPRAYTTVMSVMHRLDRKGLVSRHREGRADVYRPRTARSVYRSARAEAELELLIEQYGEAAYAAIARRIE